MNTENLDEVLREYIDDGGSTKVYESALDELQTLTEEHKFMTDQINKLNTEMTCGHLQRYQMQENDTQYCAFCELETNRKERYHWLEQSNQLEMLLNDARNQLEEMQP